MQRVWTAAQKPAGRQGLGFRRLGLPVIIGPRLRKHKHIMRNLEIAFPDKESRWIRRQARDVWRELGRVLAEYPHMRTLAAETADPRIEVCAEFDLDLLRSAKTGFVIVGMHQANWNVGALAGAVAGFPLDVVFAEQKNARFEAMMAGQRDFAPCCRFISVE